MIMFKLIDIGTLVAHILVMAFGVVTVRIRAKTYSTPQSIQSNLTSNKSITPVVCSHRNTNGYYISTYDIKWYNNVTHCIIPLQIHHKKQLNIPSF